MIKILWYLWRRKPLGLLSLYRIHKWMKEQKKDLDEV